MHRAGKVVTAFPWSKALDIEENQITNVGSAADRGLFVPGVLIGTSCIYLIEINRFIAHWKSMGNEEGES